MTESLDIIDFLPKYPFIDDDDYTTYPSQSLEEVIYYKKEFNENKLTSSESKPTRTGQLMKHQKIVSRYMSVTTPYDGLLLFHAMGSGKACSAVGIGEQMKSQNKINPIKGMIFLARGPNILNNIAKELVYVCTDGRYIPEDIEKIKPEMRMSKIKRELGPFYRFYTIHQFVKILSRMTEQEIKNTFSNYAICIDEVHNLRTRDIGSEKVDQDIVKNYYELIHSFLHTIRNKKVILLSGTPMADQPSEIATIMNLILPIDKQMPTGSLFDKEFLIPETDLIQNINPDNKEKLRNYFKGRVSYLKSIKSDIDVRYIGDNLGILRVLKIFPDILPDTIQNRVYLKAFETDSQKIQDVEKIEQETEENLAIDQEGKTGLYHNSQQASICVFPDGSYGSEGFKRYISESSGGSLQSAVMGKSSQVSYILNSKPLDSNGKVLKSIKAFINENGTDMENRLDQLSKISVKFANVVMELFKRINNPETNGSSFVYCNWVKGSGCILFANILEIFGFRKAKGGETDKKLRYGLLTSAVATDNQISSLIETFNQSENKYGEIINVIIGSKVIGEGISLKNVQDIHILTPHWNYTVTEQALTRAIRAFAHNELKKTKPDVNVNVYLHATIPTIFKNNIETPDVDSSIDVRMYEKSEHKDISMKRIEYIMKESAFDCGLNYFRNYRGGTDTKDGSRDCDYGKCQYRCIGWKDESKDEYISTIPKNKLDFSTYRLYYQSDRIVNLTEIIYKLFRQFFVISYNQLYSMYSSEYSEFELLSALKQIINTPEPILNKYGIEYYVTHYKNSFYLVNNLDNSCSAITQQYYTKYQPIVPDINFKQIVLNLSKSNYPRIIKKLCSLEWIGKNAYMNNSTRLSNFIKLPKYIQNIFFESAYIADTTKSDNINTQMVDWLLSLAEPYITTIKHNKQNIVVNLFGATDTPPSYRYLDNDQNIWLDAPEDISKTCSQYVTKILKKQESSPYEYYGIVSFEKFFIKRTKQSAQTKGQNCETMDIWKLYDILLRLSTIPKSLENYTDYPDLKYMINTINKNPDIIKMQENLKKSTIKLSNKVIDGIKTIYWYIDNKIQKNRICQDIKEILSRKGYVIGFYLTTKTIVRIPGKTGKVSRK